MSAASVRVALFCGGRGSATLIRELLRRPRVELSLLVNAYDDGLSTGALRAFIPGMLGPSDFRKNISYLIDLHSAGQYALRALLEHRLPKDAAEAAHEAAALREWIGGAPDRVLPASLRGAVEAIPADTTAAVHRLLRAFEAYRIEACRQGTGQRFSFADCSLGNLVFAGAYLESGRDFNKATALLAAMAGSRARIINVSRGECRTLAAVKADGTILETEAAVVGPQSASPIEEFFLLADPLAPGEAAALRRQAAAAAAPGQALRDLLRAREAPVALSEEAAAAIAAADVIIYGPGTQHSSLLPSYRIAAAALRAAPAAVKAFVCNLGPDHDIQGDDAARLVARALRAIGDPANQHRCVTHILHDDAAGALPFPPAAADACPGATLVRGRYANPAKPGAHSGHAVVERILSLCEAAGTAERALDIYLDLHGRGIALDGILQEFLEIDWRSRFERVCLIINGLPVPGLDLPPHLSVVRAADDGDFPEVGAVTRWLAPGGASHLATVTGDGEYRLRDVLTASAALDGADFSVVLGSRNQSRRQFNQSLRAAYADSAALRAGSKAGAYLLSALCALRFGLLLSDPLTGFRLYRRSRVPAPDVGVRTPSALLRGFVRAGAEIAEIPIGYRTFRGFTDARWRLRRGLRDLCGLLG